MAFDLMKKIKNWVIESDEEEKKEEKENKTNILPKEEKIVERKPITKTKPSTTVEQKPVVKQTAKVQEEKKYEEKKEDASKQIKKEEKTVEQTKTTSFLRVDEKVVEEKEVKNTEVRTSYRPSQPISPIFGNSQVETYNIGSSQLEYDDDKSNTSIIGTIFSPIYGKDIKEVAVEDKVDDQIATMTTKDFITKTNLNTENTVKHVEPPVITKMTDEENMTKINNAEKYVKDISDTYENLKLFD